MHPTWHDMVFQGMLQKSQDVCAGYTYMCCRSLRMFVLFIRMFICIHAWTCTSVQSKMPDVRRVVFFRVWTRCRRGFTLEGGVIELTGDVH
jgi:hypothetical protein